MDVGTESSDRAAQPGSAEDGPRALDVSGGIAAGFYELLRSDIVSGRLAPGQRLSEASFSRQHRVSRSPVREALAWLERDGLIEHRGLIAHVRERSPEETLDIYEVRIMLEGAVAADAAQRRHPYDLRQLEAALRRGEAISPDEPAELMKANRVFHDALGAASHNLTLVDLQDRLTAQVSTMPATTLSAPGRWDEAKDEHTRIAAAVEAGDVDAARAIAIQHMTRARDIRMWLHNQPHPPPPGRMAGGS